MGILNATPDSFHAPSRVEVQEALASTERMIAHGASIIDVGGSSSRPGAADVQPQEELQRVLPVIEALHGRWPELLISIDTFHASVAKEAVLAGAGLVNDISAGLADAAMLATVAELGVPYIAMHMQGTPRTMQRDPQYTDVVKEVYDFLVERKHAALAVGIRDIVLDPGFGFGKTTAHNFALLRELRSFLALGSPLLIGLSRKRMINEILGTTAAEALNGTTVLNTIALMNGASVLRVHDVREAMEAVQLYRACRVPKAKH